MPNPFHKKKGSNASTPFSSTPSIPDLFNEDDGPLNRDEQNVGQDVPTREEVFMEGPIEPNMGPSLADVLLCTFESTNAGFSSFPVRKLLS